MYITLKGDSEKKQKNYKSKKYQEIKHGTDTKNETMEIIAITLTRAKEQSPILLSQYWENEQFDSTKILLYFGCTNIIFVDSIYYISS